MSGRKRLLYFFAGMMAGAVLVISLSAVAVWLGGNQPHLLRVNTHGITEKIESAARVKVNHLLPVYIEEIKESVPDLVDQGLGSPFADAYFQLGGTSYPLPKEFVSQLEQSYRASLVEALYDLLDSLPLAEMGAELGEEIAAVVANSIYAEFNHRQLNLGVTNFLSLPLRIELFNHPGEDVVRFLFFSKRDVNWLPSGE